MQPLCFVQLKTTFKNGLLENKEKKGWLLHKKVARGLPWENNEPINKGAWLKPVDDSNYGCTECEALNIVKALNNVGRENERCYDDRNIFHASLTTQGSPCSWLGIRGVVMNDICINLEEEKARRNQCKLYIHIFYCFDTHWHVCIYASEEDSTLNESIVRTFFPLFARLKIVAVQKRTIAEQLNLNYNYFLKQVSPVLQFMDFGQNIGNYALESLF
ncbi:hypothetical protein E2320_008621 [Naja naja]|nr:hypothetical protein E2320_008621 [Naja naja]